MAVHSVFSSAVMQMLMRTGLPVIIIAVDLYPDLPLPLVATETQIEDPRTTGFRDRLRNA